MSGPSWDAVKEICVSALERPEEQREAFLEEACAGDANLRREVDGLLARHDPDFLETPFVRVDMLQEPGSAESSGADDSGEGTQGPWHGRRLGPYRVVRPIGTGGMGEVFLAVQEGDGFERPVAIKLVRAGMATEDLLERFRLERSILASLNHPNLAQLIDGGSTPDGLPYFVMEFVDGLPITEYCDRESLTVPERLALFSDVCAAVQHAHRSLIVHRDIKPSNILVTSAGVPKLLDFGIGKVLDATGGAADRTSVTRRVLTPEYAAPEQISGALITTATDVHGLGVLLYELLAGHHPFKRAETTPEQLDRAVLETAPPLPSARARSTASPPPEIVGADSHGAASARTPAQIARHRSTVPHRLERMLRGDLDNIVLKALRKEPERRYSSAESLREDVGRFLEGRPVQARGDSLGYRVSKFVTRNPWAMTAGAAVLIALGTSIVVPWRQNQRLTAERDKALAVQSFLLEGFGTTASDETIGARDLLDIQASRVDSLYADRPPLQAQMLLVLADAYDRLGLYDDALPPAQRGLEIMRALHTRDHPDLGLALNAAGWALHRAGRPREGIPLLEEAVTLRRRLGRSARGELARSLNDLGVVYTTVREFEQAEVVLREALELRRTVDGDSGLGAGVTASNLAAAFHQRGDFEGAEREGRLALELLRSSVGPDHQRTVIAQNNLIAFMMYSNDLPGAADEYRDLLARQARIQGVEHPVTNRVRNSLAMVLRRLPDEASVLETESLAREILAYARDEGLGGLDIQLEALESLRRSLERQERWGEALVAIDEAVALTERLPDIEERHYPYYRAMVRSKLLDFRGAATDMEVYVRWLETTGETGAVLMDRRLQHAEFLLESGQEQRADSVLETVRLGLGADGVRQASLDWFTRLDTQRVGRR